MKIKNNILEISIDEWSQIDSIKFKNKEILYQGDEGWKKRFPIIFPSLGISSGYSYKGKKYDMPKHGWWKELDWSSFYEEDKLVSVATIMDKEKFPFSFDITQKIQIIDNKISINYELRNLDKEDAYFHFGIHPAFKIDDESYVESSSKFKEIDFNGSITDKSFEPHKKNLKKIPFGKEFDTLIADNSKEKYIKVINHEEILFFEYDSPHLQIWKPEKDNFVCIEPWYGWNDAFYNAPNNISEKKEIIALKEGETWISKFSLSVTENK